MRPGQLALCPSPPSKNVLSAPLTKKSARLRLGRSTATKTIRRRQLRCPTHTWVARLISMLLSPAQRALAQAQCDFYCCRNYKSPKKISCSPLVPRSQYLGQRATRCRFRSNQDPKLPTLPLENVCCSSPVVETVSLVTSVAVVLALLAVFTTQQTDGDEGLSRSPAS